MVAEFFINRFLSVDFPVIIDDRSAGSIRLFAMIDDKSQLIPITICYSVWPGKESQFGLNDKKV